ncbi:MAG TPA: MaoC family dehydratase [Candidatus Lustribacter sp.]
MARYLEDLKPGQAFESRRHAITQDEIVAFAREYDPQPFHVDPSAASSSFFGKLIASGWHTAALTMKMLTEAEMDLAGGIIGAGMEELKWPTPLVPGDVIHVRVEILESRASKSRPQIGIVRARVRALREDGTAVQEMIANLIVPSRPG